jgi:hypothetical protein
MNNYAALSQELVDSLHLDQPPIALSFSNDAPVGISEA